MSKSLSFNGTTFSIANHNHQIWLRGTEIASALGMKTTDAVTQIYHRNSDEFNDNMTLTLKLKVKGFGGGNSEKDVRVFSLRGAHLIAMFARTPIAKEFRKWVLDILDKEVGTVQQKIIQPPSLQTPIRRYYVEVKIHDNLMNSSIIIPAKTDSFNTLITGLAVDLGFCITGMSAVTGGMEKLIARAQAVAITC